VAVRLRELLAAATPDDVQEIDAEIALKEEELAKLRANRKLLAAAVGLEEPKRGPGRRTGAKASGAKAEEAGGPPKVAWGGDLTERRKIALKHLRAVGQCSLDALSTATRIARQGPGNLSAVLAHEWFHVSPEHMVSLTDKGDRVSL